MNAEDFSKMDYDQLALLNQKCANDVRDMKKVQKVITIRMDELAAEREAFRVLAKMSPIEREKAKELLSR